MRHPDLFALNPRSYITGASPYSIVGHMLRYVMDRGYVVPDEFTQERNRHTPTAYGTYGSFAKYMEDHTKPCGRWRTSPNSLVLIRRVPLLKRCDRSMLTWVGPERAEWIHQSTPQWRDRVFQHLERRMVEKTITEEEWKWFQLLR